MLCSDRPYGGTPRIISIPQCVEGGEIRECDAPVSAQGDVDDHLLGPEEVGDVARRAVRVGGRRWAPGADIEGARGRGDRGGYVRTLGVPK